MDVFKKTKIRAKRANPGWRTFVWNLRYAVLIRYALIPTLFTVAILAKSLLFNSYVYARSLRFESEKTVSSPNILLRFLAFPPARKELTPFALT